MNKKTLKVIVSSLIVLESIFVFLACASFFNKDIVEYKETNVIDREKFAMYLENLDGEYEKYTGNYFPAQNYILNSTKTVCIDNKDREVADVISYDNGKITISSNKTLYCNIYFDIDADIFTTVTVDGAEGDVLTGSGYQGSLTCTNATYSWDNTYQRVKFSNISSNKINCTLNYSQVSNTYSSLVSVVTSNAGTQANGYRYTGKTPNNYIWFNNELWRIIGAIPVVNSNNETKTLVKIIRNDSIGGFVYDATGTNYTGEWGSNTLYNLLNEHFYATSFEKLNGQSHEGCYAQSNVAHANCRFENSGILASDYYGKMVEEVYWGVGSADVSGIASDYYTKENENLVKGHIGLMSLSDYAYATDSIFHNQNVSTFTSQGASSKDWLFGIGYEWTLTQDISKDENALYIDDTGAVSTYAAVKSRVVRPVVYLDASVYVVSGDGSMMNPYIIGM